MIISNKIPVWEILRNKSLSSFYLGNIADSLNLIDQALALNDRYIDAYNTKAWILVGSNRQEEALPVIQKSLEVEPENPKSLQIHAYVLFSLNSFKKSIEVIDKSLSINSSDKESWYLKGKISTKKNNLKEAERCFNKAISIDKNFSESYNDKAIVLYKKRDYDDALQNIKEAIRIDSTSLTYQQNLIKLTVFNEKKTTSNFIEFWNQTRKRKAIAIALIIAAILTVIFPIIIYPYYPDSNEIIVNSTNNSQEIVKTATSLSKSTQISEYNLVLIGFIILVLLFPQIKTAKIGPIELTPVQSQFDYLEFSLEPSTYPYKPTFGQS